MKDRKKAELMGKIVTVMRVYRRNHDEKRCWWKDEVLDLPRAGWIVGFRFIQNGEYVPASGPSGAYDGDFKPAYLEVECVVPVVLVSYWPTMKSEFVPLDGFVEGGKPCYTTQLWPEKWKNGLRDAMAKVPRDKKGRWLRET